MKRKWIKWVSWIILTPIILFVILIVLLYIPPIQNFLRKEATAYASKATGMNITIERIDLRFPLNLLVRGVEVVQAPDTLLRLESLNVHVQAIPLFRGEVEVDDISLENATVNSAGLLKGMRVEGTLGRFDLSSHGVDLRRQTAVINRAELEDTDIRLLMNDTTATPKDSTQSSTPWKATLQKLQVKNVSFRIDLPADSMRLAAHIGEAEIEDAEADLKEVRYALGSFLLSGSSVRYDRGDSLVAAGFDPSHIALRDIRIRMDSLLYGGRNIRASIDEFSMNERSGLSVVSLTGQVFSNDTLVKIPRLKLQTAHSEVSLSAQTYWKLIHTPTAGRLDARLDALLGKQDLFLFAGNLPDSFREAYPSRPLTIHAGTEGNLKEMQITRLRADLPGAFTLSGDGELRNLTDSVNRSAQLDFKLITQKLDFLTALGGTRPDGSITIPGNMQLKGEVGMKGSQYTAALAVEEGAGRLRLDADYNGNTEAYNAKMNIHKLQVHHFLPKDSIYEVSASADVKGRGTDFTSYRSVAALDFRMDSLHYGRFYVSDIDASATLRHAVATAKVTSNNELLKMTADAEYYLNKRYIDGKADIDVAQLDLYKLGVNPAPLKRPFAFHLSAEASKDSVTAHLASGDLHLSLAASPDVEKLIKQSTRLMTVLQKQLDEKKLNHEQLSAALPTVDFSLTSGRDNPVYPLLSARHIGFQDARVRLSTVHDGGIHGNARVHALKMDTLQLDTVFFNLNQDTASVRFRGGVVNGPQNPQFIFTATATGEIRNNDAEVTLQYLNAQGETGLLLGVSGRPRKNGDGLVFSLLPEEPVIAFRKFHFVDGDNWLYLHKNKRLYANIDMLDAQGTGFRMHSVQGDSVSLQNMDVELRRIRLDELSSILPYFPEISGLLSAEAHYVQTATSLQLSGEASVDELIYKRRRVGDIAVGATWLPGEKGKQYINAYFNYEDKEVMLADGALYRTAAGKDSVVVNTTLEHFPLAMANAFIPDETAILSGDLDGELRVTGSTQAPLVNGELALDSVAVFIPQAGARFRFDNHPLEIRGSRLQFDEFAIYTTSNNPFTLNGNVDFRNLSQPLADLSMRAENYTLLDAERTKKSLVYGKVMIDLDATAKGALDALVMRGNINLLSSTDVTYVLTDSPLTVQDRLGELVTFTSFADTTSLTKQQDTRTLSLGGLDMIMMVQIDPAVRLRADLTPDRSSRVEVQGGGNLTLQYTPQGDLSLAGRYTLIGGLIKYTVPVIPLKEFSINNGSYVEWTGNVMDPLLNLTATERVRASVGGENGQSRMVNFDITIAIKNRLEDLGLTFDISAPEDATVQNQLASMTADERSKQAIAMLATGIYLADSGSSTGGLNMGAALNSVLTSQINSLMGNMKNASFTVGAEERSTIDGTGTQTDYNFRYSQRLFNDRFQIVIGGKVSTGAQATNDAESFIDNISLEYRLDASGTRYIRLFHDKNYQSILEGEITETGIGLVLRKRINKLGELFVFKRKKKK